MKDAVRLLDRMTERERYRTRGLFYLVTSDYQACVKEYGDLIAGIPLTLRRTTIALCAFRSSETWPKPWTKCGE